MDYASLTLQDPNRLKRWIHRARFSHSLHSIADWPGSFAGRILDVGAGDGRLCLDLATRFPSAEIVCFEPAAMFRSQAERNLAGKPRVSVVGDWEEVALASTNGVRGLTSTLQEATGNSRDDDRGPFDLIFCLEVLEHLPGKETRSLVDHLAAVAGPCTQVVISVPNEIHMAAFLKGLFRASRRYGSFDATARHVGQATLGRPPLRRPLARLSADNRYYFHHLGFDYRRLEKHLARQFVIERRYGSPFVKLPLPCNNELFFVCRKRRAAVVE